MTNKTLKPYFGGVRKGNAPISEWNGHVGFSTLDKTTTICACTPGGVKVHMGDVVYFGEDFSLESNHFKNPNIPIACIHPKRGRSQLFDIDAAINQLFELVDKARDLVR